MTAIFTTVVAENNDETAVTKTAAITSAKFSSHRSKISFSEFVEFLSFAYFNWKY